MITLIVLRLRYGCWEEVCTVFNASHIPRIGETVIHDGTYYTVNDVQHELGAGKVSLYVDL